jgi:hypothetical protein
MKRTSSTIIFGVALFLGMSTVQARPHIIVTHTHVNVERNVVVRPTPVRTVVNQLSSIRIGTLPREHVRIIHVGNTYHYHNGIYYVRDKGGYVVVKPAPRLREVTVIKRS